ncbi:hypothetical protein [Limosilactobacillus fermentum]
MESLLKRFEAHKETKKVIVAANIFFKRTHHQYLAHLDKTSWIEVTRFRPMVYRGGGIDYMMK